ncbi:hypothetical protein [Cellulomonas sp. NTE-D12]|uniref:hypothetical protein n=1 Tax=Cellulomonas sp. NTE-D12 TaxID=2962632 RepID=UPI0030820499|nr:hypothetical protein CELD12_01430 [Cellulomonas sp. NTE-D12]
MSATVSLWSSRAALRWVTRLGLAGAGLAVLIAWWVALGYASGLLAAASAVATVGFVGAVTGYRRRWTSLIVIGLVVAALAAPTGFAYLGNLIALVSVVATAAQLARGTARHRPAERQG